MKVLCIDDRPELAITQGKIYEVFSEDTSGYKILDDESCYRFYWKERFSVAEFRNMKLRELGI